MSKIIEEANGGIIGLGAGPYATKETELGTWPTAGYDNQIIAMDWEAKDRFEMTGRTREEWIELADIMLQRWLDFRVAVAAGSPKDPA